MDNKTNYIITCTSGVDIDRDLLKNNNIVCIEYKYVFNDVEYTDDYYQTYDNNKFFDDLVKGGIIKTSQIGYGRYSEFFEEYLKQGKNVLHIALSSGITGDTQTAQAVARELNEKYKDNKVYVLDSTCCSTGYGMFALMVAKKRDEGLSFEDLINYGEQTKYLIHHWFISTDLSFYVRGGRISNVEGFFGKALKICPLLYVDYDGRLIPFEKIRTKNRAIEELLEKMKDYCIKGMEYDDDVYIYHTVCKEDADTLANMIKDNFKNIKNLYIMNIGPSIGAHTGPKTLSFSFIGKNRKEIIKED